jgi:WD40 repeat protein
VRWLHVGGRDAVAAVGSGDGGPGADTVTLYGVRTDAAAGGLQSRVIRKIAHSGKVSDLSTSAGFAALFAASSDGHVRALVDADADEMLRDVAKMPKGAGGGRESASGVSPLAERKIAAVGANGTLVVADVDLSTIVSSVQGGDAVGFRACAAVDPQGGHEVVTAGASGVVCVWDVRVATRTKSAAQTLRHPDCAGGAPLCVTVDASQPQFVVAGTAGGELGIWDRRGGDGFPLSRTTVHDGFVWDARVVASSRPGLLVSCGEDARVWLMDFAAAAGRGATGGAAAGWRQTGEFWRAELGECDVRSLSAAAGATLGVNSVDAHPHADLFAYTTDSAAVTFGRLWA